MYYNTNSDECGELQSTAPGTQPPEGHDRDYHLKKADGSPDYHIPLVKSLLERSDVTLHEAIVYGVLLDMLGKNHTYCCPKQGTIASILKISLSSVRRAMVQLKAKGLITPKFVRCTNKYFLPDRHVALAKLDERASSHRTTLEGNEVVHTELPQEPGSSHRTTYGPSSLCVNDITNEEAAKRTTEGNEELRGSAPQPQTHPHVVVENAGSEHRQIKAVFCKKYMGVFNKEYIWQVQDGAILKGILKLDITPAEIKGAIETMFKDQWIIDKRLASMKMFKTDLNKYRLSGPSTAAGPADNGWDAQAIKVHTRPQPGEPKLAWPWPRTGQPRVDGDIPLKLRGRGMHEFSSVLVHHVRDWILRPVKSGSWGLTMIGTYGNGKTNFVVALLQAWRDHMTPDLQSNQIASIESGQLCTDTLCLKSQFLSFANFCELCSYTPTNSKSGFIGKEQVNIMFIEALSKVDFLVLDDICSCPVDPVVRKAMHDLLRLREEAGQRITVITTNRSLTEIGTLLGGSVADRLTAGKILSFIDAGQRDQANPNPTGQPHTRGLPNTMPNPEGLMEKAYIPCVELNQ